MKQVLGQEFEFKCKHKWTLPISFEISNEDVKWNKDMGKKNKGSWCCRIC